MYCTLTSRSSDKNNALILLLKLTPYAVLKRSPLQWFGLSVEGKTSCSYLKLYIIFIQAEGEPILRNTGL